MSTIRFFKSSSIEFIDLYYYDNLQSDQTRLYYDTVYQNIYNDCYFVKKDKSRPLIFQFRTDYKNFTFKLVNESGFEYDITNAVQQVKEFDDGSDIIQYKLNRLVDQQSSGYYYITGYFEDQGKPIGNFQSQWFELQESYENCLLIECNQGQYGTNNDGIVWDDDNEYMWVDSRIARYVAGGESATFRSSNGKLITSKFTPIKSKIWECELIPDIQLEKINLWRGKSFFWINEVQYNSEEIPESEAQGDTRLYPLSYQLELVQDAIGYAYEDYTSDNEMKGDIPPVPIRVLAINDTQALGVSNTKALGI